MFRFPFVIRRIRAPDPGSLFLRLSGCGVEHVVAAAGPWVPKLWEILGLPDTTAWTDELNRPHHIYHGEPIYDLL